MQTALGAGVAKEGQATLNSGEPWSSTCLVDLLTAMLRGEWVGAIARMLCRSPEEMRERVEREKRAVEIEAGQHEYWQNSEPCLVRYGDPPTNGHSCNASTGELEDGVSVFHGQALPDGAARAVPHTLRQLVTALRHDSENSPLYVVTGYSKTAGFLGLRKGILPVA
jgi:hypothetical protein